MKRLITLLIALVGMTTVSLAVIYSPVILAADATTPAQTEICEGANQGGTCDSGGSTLDPIISGIINVFSVVVGIVAVVMIIYGGFRYITSAGDSGKVTAARTTIVYALVGLVIVALAQIIVKFVLNKVTTTGS